MLQFYIPLVTSDTYLAFQESDTNLYSHQESIEGTCLPETSVIVVVISFFLLIWHEVTILLLSFFGY